MNFEQYHKRACDMHEEYSMKEKYTLYLVTDRALMSTVTLSRAVEQAIQGGCTMVQLREKDSSSLDFYDMAKEVRRITQQYGVPLIINDRIDIALSIHAEGVHIGQSDIPAAAAKKILGKDMLLGVSASNLREAIQAQKDGADYLGVGAMFATGTKSDARLVAMEELQAICRAVSIPVVAIGGINKDNAGRFTDSGVDGLAIVSAIISQPDIREAAKEMKQIFLGKGTGQMRSE